MHRRLREKREREGKGPGTGRLSTVVDRVKRDQPGVAGLRGPSTCLASHGRGKQTADRPGESGVPAARSDLP